MGLIKPTQNWEDVSSRGRYCVQFDGDRDKYEILTNPDVDEANIAYFRAADKEGAKALVHALKLAAWRLEMWVRSEEPGWRTDMRGVPVEVSKPTIAELEAILQEKDVDIEILPNGEARIRELVEEGHAAL